MKSFFMEGDKLSMVRLNLFTSCIVAYAIAIMSIIKSNTTPSVVALVGVLVGSSITGKFMQKKNEK